MFPKLIYIGDVPVESSYHGSAVLYRLLRKYAGNGLTVIETGSPSAPNRRLLNAGYQWLPLARARWMNTRFHPYAVGFYSAAARSLNRQLLKSLKNVEFDAVLTVAHGFGWLAAAAIAKRKRVPLHLLVHDDWPRVARVPRLFKRYLNDWFADVYRLAESRMCVTPVMRDTYYQQYGRSAHILYPMQNHGGRKYHEPPSRLSRNDHDFTVAFAGTINTDGYVGALKSVHSALQPINGRLLIFGPWDAPAARGLGLDLPGITLCGLIAPDQLIEKLRDQADALFVPMSFAKEDAVNMEMAFPSKLADYTAAGVPLLIYGPKYCSAVRWANENQTAAIVVSTSGTNELAEEICKLADSAAERLVLGKQALEVGVRYFSPEMVQQVFDHALTRPSSETQFTTLAVSCSPS